MFFVVLRLEIEAFAIERLSVLIFSLTFFVVLRVVCQGNIVAYSRCPFLCVDWGIVSVFYVEAFVFRSCVLPLVNFVPLICG